MPLKTDYKDALYDGNRVYKLVPLESAGTYNIVDGTQYHQVGDKFGANDINEISTIVNGVRSDMDILIAKSNALDDKTTTFNSDGSIVETMSGYVKTTTFPQDGSVLETLTYLDGQIRQKRTRFVGNEIIEEVLEI